MGATSATATVLVTDLVASTDLRVSIGEERADAMRRDLDTTSADAVTAHGGSIVKGLGDGVLALFPGAAEAIAAGVAVQQAAERLSRSSGVQLAVRVGASSGDVSLEDGDCFGMPVVEASRLCAAAAGGEILIADVVRLLARGRGGHEFQPRGPLDLKGIPEPVETWSVGWEPASSGADLRDLWPYTGRERERQVLHELFGLVQRGSGKTVLVAGEPGIGKTRLVAEVCAAATAAGATVLWGACHDGDVAAHAALAEAIGSWAQSAAADEVVADLGRDAAVLALVAPAIGDRLPDLPAAPAVPPDAATARLHDALCQWLGRLAARHPLVLVLDDLHWADDATIGALRAIARRTRGQPVLLIGTYRETDLDRAHPLAEALPILRREVEPTRLALDGLDAGEVHAMLERLAGHDVPTAFAELLAGQCDGNPFFIRETLLHLREEGRIALEDGVWVATTTDLGIPEGVREVLGRRLARLSDDANRLLAVGALFEVAFPLAVVAQVCDVDEDVALDAVDEALAAQIIRAGAEFDTYVFTHALFRQTLVSELNPSRQVRLHRAIADALEKGLRGDPTPAEAATLARHFERSAAMPGAERGVGYAILAGTDAEARAAYREAYDLFVVARELMAPGEEREIEVQRRVATNAVLAQAAVKAQTEEASQLGQLVSELDGDDAAADELKELVVLANSFDDVTTVWRLAEVARRHLRPDRRDWTWAHLRHWELAERDATDPEQPGLTLDTPEQHELIGTVLSLPWSSQSIAALSVPRDVVVRWLGEAEAAGAAEQAVMLNFYGGDMGATFAGAKSLYNERLSEGVLPGAVLFCAIAVRAALALGDHDEADRLLGEGMQLLPRISERSNPAFQLLACWSFAGFIRGAPIEATAFPREAVADPNTRWAGVAIRAGGACAAAWNGNREAALRDLRQVLPAFDRAAGWAPNYPLIAHFLTSAIFILDHTGDELATVERSVYEKVLQPDVRYLESDPRWSAARVACLAGRGDEAFELFDAARAVLTESRAAALIVAVDHDDALAALRAGDGDRASTRLAAGRAGCSHPAMAAWLARFDALETALNRSP